MTGKFKAPVVMVLLAGLVGITCVCPGLCDSKGQFPKKGSYTAWINANVFYQKGVEWAGHGHPERAVDSFEKAIATYPFDSLFHYNLGVARTAAGDPAQAEASFRRALELEPQYFPAWYNLGSLLVRLERPQQAKEAWEQALKIKGISDADRQSVEKLLNQLTAPEGKKKRGQKKDAGHKKRSDPKKQSVQQKDPGRAQAGGEVTESQSVRAEEAAPAGRQSIPTAEPHQDDF